MSNPIFSVHVKQLTDICYVLSERTASVLTAIAVRRLKAERPTPEVLLEDLASKGFDEEKLEQTLGDLCRHGYLIQLAPEEEAGEARYDLPSSLYAYFRTGQKGFVHEFEEFRLQPTMELIAEFLHAINQEMEHVFSEAAEVHEKVIDFIQRIDTTPEFKRVSGELREVAYGQHYFMAALCMLSFAQYALNRAPLKLPVWAGVLKPKLAERRKLLGPFLRAEGVCYGRFLEPADQTPSGIITAVRPHPDIIRELDLDRNFLPFEEEVRSDAFDVVLPDAIRPRELLYSAGVEAELAAVAAQLTGRTFEERRAQLEAVGVPGGLSVLLAGESGVGKTACAEVWSKASGRPLIRVNLAALRGKYMGESERFTQGLFRQLAAVRAQMPREPLVLLDEADGFLHRRTPGSDVAHQVETNLVAILLREIEAFDGILVATTNHAASIDPAFFRRFLLTVTVPLPDAGVRATLLQRVFPLIAPTAATAIASRLAFSPAHVERVARQIQLLEGPDGAANPALLESRLLAATRGWEGVDGSGSRSPLGYLHRA